MGGRPHGARFGPGGRRAYTVLTQEDALAVLDARRNALLQKIKLRGCRVPFWLALP